MEGLRFVQPPSQQNHNGASSGFQGDGAGTRSEVDPEKQLLLVNA